jgi:hypothetical protein
VVEYPIDDHAAAFYAKFGFILLPDSKKMFSPHEDDGAFVQIKKTG